MHTGRVERVIATADPQEARTLLECLGAEARNVEQSLAVAERPRLVAVRDDGLGQATRTRRRPGTAAATDAVFRSTPTAFTASSTTASRLRASVPGVTSCWYCPTPIDFGLDLDQFGQRILQPPRDRHRAAQGDVEVGQFCAAYAEAEYTDAPASLTMAFAGIGAGGPDVGDEFGGQRVGLA